MKNLLMKISAVVAAVIIFVGCQGEKSSNKAEISGQFVGLEAKMVYLEAADGSEYKVVDSVALDDKGCYKFEIKEAPTSSALYNVVYNKSRMPLLVSRGEKVTLSAEGSPLENYTVSGSPESELLCNFNKMYIRFREELKDIIEQTNSADQATQEELKMQYNIAYNALKRKQITLIIENKESLAAVYALYQRLPGEIYLSGSEASDAIQYRTVLDAVSKRYPNSSLVEKLKKDVELMESRIRVLQLVEERSYPELKGSDIYGKEHTLSSLEGNVILVDFWSAESGVSNITNADLKDIYKMYEPKGFRIYQVSADTSKATWVAAVVDQHLPWVSVCDLKGAASPMVLSYNIQKLPSNFLIDRDGKIVAKDLYGEALKKKLAEMFK
jgi:peroxiredoxin